MAPKKKTDPTLEIIELKSSTLDVHIVGTTPLIYNAMSKKVKEGLLFPPEKITPSQKKTKLKHDPVSEYRSSVYRQKDPDSEPILFFPGGGVKKAIAQAAIDVPGAAKAQIGRLASVNEWDVPIWGTPQMLMSVVRNSDMSRTPDVRTRAILPEWAARFSITFTTPQLNETVITHLTAAAGIIVGIGDWRPQKGSGTFGRFQIVDPDDAAYKRITETQGADAQLAGLEDPACFDLETEELLEFFRAEARRREFKVS